jgi:(2Fe-2S) ferredoxin
MMLRLPTCLNCRAKHPPVENASAGGEYIAMLPAMEPYRRHVLVCTGGFCSPNRDGRELYAMLPELLDREGLLFGPGRVKRGETPCLGVCAGVTRGMLERIVKEHLRDGRVVEDAVFFRL